MILDWRPVGRPIVGGLGQDSLRQVKFDMCVEEADGIADLPS